MELGNDDNGKRQASAHIKTLKTLLTKENVTFFGQLGGDVGDHVNKAMEVYVRWLHAQECVLPAAQEAHALQHLTREGENGES